MITHHVSSPMRYPPPPTLPRAEALDALYATLAGRHRPEDVLVRIMQLGPEVLGTTYTHLHNARAEAQTYTLMPSEFTEPASSAASIRVLGFLVRRAQGRAVAGPDDIDVADLLTRRAPGIVAEARGILGMESGETNFKIDRKNRSGRALYATAHGTPRLSRRQYDKLFRLVARLEAEETERERQWRVFRLTRIAKTAFASSITRADFDARPEAAAFIAYYTAALGRRSLFTAGPQPRAYDQIAAALLARALTPTADVAARARACYAMAHVYPRTDVLALVPDAQKAALLALAWGALRESADLLAWVDARSSINRLTMIVRKGNDSSTWNALAGAWNKARDIWISLVAEMGMADTLEQFCPGKVLRLMAADVAYMHSHYGNGPQDGSNLHLDTRVWAQLPPPWTVMRGDAVCTRAMVEAACRYVGVDPVTSGWTGPRERTHVAPVEPTYDLVHGIEVADPAMAQWLKHMHVWSGKPARWTVE